MIFWPGYFLFFMMLMEHLDKFSSAVHYFDGPVVEKDEIQKEPTHQVRLLGSSVGKYPRQKGKKTKTTPKGKTDLPYNSLCTIEVYHITTIIEKNKFQTTISHEAYRMYPKVLSKRPKPPEHVLSMKTSINKEYTIETFNNVPCADPDDDCHQSRAVHSLTKVDLHRFVGLMPNILNGSRNTHDHESYLYHEKLDWQKHEAEKMAIPNEQIFRDIPYIRDPCRGPGANQLFECYKDPVGKSRCQCLRDKRPTHLDKEWLIWDKKSKICVAPVESICAIRDTEWTGSNPIQCAEKSQCIHTTGLDDSYVFCSRIDHKILRKTSKLYIQEKTSAAHQTPPYLQLAIIHNIIYVSLLHLIFSFHCISSL